jgi:hypothetical protein
MSSSRSTTFRTGAFAGWHLAVMGETAGGEAVRTIVTIGAPRGERRGGILTFAPGVPGFDVTVTALRAGPGEDVAALEAVVQWVIDATREALATRDDITVGQRDYWQSIVNEADASRADWRERYPHGDVHPFRVIGCAYVTPSHAQRLIAGGAR